MRKKNLLYFLSYRIENMNIQEHFKLPIYYNSDKKQVNQNIINDLELVKTLDGSANPIYSFFFDLKEKKDFAYAVLNQSTELYTTDINFLKEYQQLLQNYKSIHHRYTANNNTNFQKIQEIWNDIKNDTGFKEKYYYIDWPMWEFLNNSETFLQFMSIYNMMSPVISLLLPIIILIIPFFVIQLKGLHLTIEEYIEVLKIILSQHALGKLFNEFNDVSINQKIYLLISAAFYVFSIYQNVLSCVRFHQNMSKIHTYFKDISEYLDYTISNMENYLCFSNKLFTHKEFNCVAYEKMNILKNLHKKISFISDYKLTTRKFFEIGHILKYFYEIYDNQEYNDALLYSFGFNGYTECLNGILHNLETKKIYFIEFSQNKQTNNNTKKKKKTIFKKSYYAALKDQKHIKNTIKLDKNVIITGPNASGKTTVLKSTLINILLSQQFGCGFYNIGSKLAVFDNIHCYLNIPDTSGRDSLFQAEARRCKEIIDFIHDKKKETHFCVFDELYSGTNPEEAETSAISLMDYLVKNTKVSVILTTHYINVCKNLEKNKNIVNYHMDVSTDEKNDFQYTYVLSKGISNTKGGIKVLKDMNYPKEILDNIAR